MADKLRISIVTPSYNQADFIERTIDSVLSQQGDFELDYRVIDGASTDGTVDILRRYGDRFAWTSEPDAGQVDAINKGLRAATGDVVAWLNSDDVLVPGALAQVARRFQEDPALEWLHGRCDIIDADDQPLRSWISLYKHLRAKRHSLENLLTENYVSQMTAFWKRRLHDEIGYLDPNLKLAFDYDLWLRLASRTAPAYVPTTLARFRWYPTSKSGAQFERQFREDLEVAIKYAGHRRGLLLRKRAKSWAIVAIYRALAAGRSGSSGSAAL